MTETVILPYTPVRTTPLDIEGLRNTLEKVRPAARLRSFNTSVVPAWLSEISGPKTVTITLNNDPYLPVFDYVPGVKFFAPPLGKVALLRKLADAGLPVPRSATWRDDLPVTEANFGPYVAIKTTAPGTVRARGIFVCRTSEFARLKPKLREAFAAEITAGFPPVVQEYVNTGERPCHTRVSTFLGAPIVCFQTISPDRFDPTKLDGLAGGEATSNFSDARTRKLVDDPEMVALAQKVCTVFQRTAVLSTDMVRSVETGKLFVLETNLGNLGVLSSVIVGGLRKELGPEAMHAQFGSYDRMARQIAAVLEQL